jgi:Peptidase inhibitor family I36
MTDDTTPEHSPRRHRTQRVLRAAILTVAMALGFVAMSAGSANAAPVGCPSTYFCFYADPDFSGGMGKVAGNNTHFSAFPTSTHNCGNGNWNDCVSSAFNNGRSCTVFLWSDANYAGRLLAIGRGTGYTNLRSVNFDDILSSNHWCTSR